VVVGGLGVEAAVDLLAGRAVQVPDLEAEAGGLDEGLGEGGDADVVGLALRGLDVVGAVGLDVAHGHEVAEVVGVRLHPGAGEQLDVGDDGHGRALVVEGVQEHVGRVAVHVPQRVGQAVQQRKGVLGEVDPDVARVADLVEQVAQRAEARFLGLAAVRVAGAEQRLEVGEGDGCAGGSAGRAARAAREGTHPASRSGRRRGRCGRRRTWRAGRPS